MYRLPQNQLGLLLASVEVYESMENTQAEVLKTSRIHTHR